MRIADAEYISFGELAEMMNAMNPDSAQERESTTRIASQADMDSF